MSEGRILGLWSGVGIVAANMIGAGVFLSAGFMAQDMGPGQILLAWVVGTIVALAGARAYATVVELVPRSGGEYRYLSALLHPVLGYLAGWGSLLLGFSAPVAVAAAAAGSFTATLFKGVDPRLVAAALIVILSLVHALGFRLSRNTQNALVGVKAVLLLGFVGVGLSCGTNQWPSWAPPHASQGLLAVPVFMRSLFFIAFAFSGWNAACYAAEEFENPKRDVPRAMLLGCSVVAVLYLLVNWVFVANLTPERATAVFDYETSRVTLGHLVMRDMVGAVGARAMSVLAIVSFVSSMSAMTLVGPRVYAAMAADGFLPRILAAREGGPPWGSVVLQGVLALVLLFSYDLQQTLQNVGAIVTLFAGLVVLSLFRVRFFRKDLPRPGPLSLASAAIYVAMAAWTLYFGFRGKTQLLLWVGMIALVALLAYLVTRLLGAGRAKDL